MISRPLPDDLKPLQLPTPSCYDVTVCPQRQRAGMRQPMTSKKRIRYWGVFDTVTGQFVRLTRIITHPARTVLKFINRRKPRG